MRPTIYLVDDDPDVLVATQRLLVSAGMTVAAFQSARTFLEHYDTATPGCLVLDLAMPEVTGPELQRTLAQRDAPLPIVFLTGRGDIRACAQAMKDGAVDFLAKPVDDADLLNAVNHALAKAAVLQRERTTRSRTESALARLTVREHQVLVHVVAGRLNKQIAADLGTGEKTVKYHRGNLMRKLGVRSVAQLVRLVQHAGVGAPGADN
ncbi:MAG TPA: response regulator [Burkholderiales bacterium]|nr:response regulator [Burkholderiales bacterium]